MVQPEHVVDAHHEYVKTLVDSMIMKSYSGVWQSAEDVDVDLSIVNVEGENWRWVQKVAHVTGLSLGDGVLIHKAPGFPAIIMGIIVGNSTLADFGDI